MRKKWQVAAPAPASHLDRFPTLSPLLAQVLYNRGLREPAQVASFLDHRWPEPDPYLLPDMERAVDILIRAIHRKERIAVYGDFDADGVTATVLLVQALSGLGADVIPYIPSRIDEGYGVNIDALRTLYSQGIRLVVTVDCGIRAVDEVAQARRALEFIITDHHSVGAALPPASAVINPHRPDSAYPRERLAGVGVAFKLAQAVIREARQLQMPVHVEERDLLDLVALGTVADIVPLTGENRALVHAGLQVINEAQRPGLRALLGVAGKRPGEVDAAAIGFILGPRLNAAGRLGDAKLSYQLLQAADSGEAKTLAARLNEKNQERRTLTEQTYARAEELALSHGDNPPLLYAAHAAFEPGIVGLVAGRLVEAHYRPSVVVELGEEESRGSCRSIDDFHITEALDACSDLLVRHGGHAAAAGFIARTVDLDALAERLFALAEDGLKGVELVPKLHIDAQVPLEELDWATIEWLEQLEPCGERNPTPLFLSTGVRIRESRTVGRESQHLKLALGGGGAVSDAIAFRMGDRNGELGEQVDLVYHLEVNHWNGQRSLQLNVQDLRPAAG